MDFQVGKIGTVFGDRVIVKKLQEAEKVGSLFLPEIARDQKTEVNPMKGNDKPWRGLVEKFGLDTRCGEAYDLKVGDEILIEPEALHCHTLADDEGFDHVWVPEEFICGKFEREGVLA